MTAMVAHSIKYPKQQERAVADANLIAAAPDLLEALEELDAMYARAWDTTDGGLHFSAESVDKFEAAHEKARVAIAKATGQA
ncbi:hypothetical protein [Azotobacter salinestris]|uniref:hypothetical protein n=1 Tax=Azotobacter salinestris TaxID=69964 RepID=UPI0032DEC44F